MLLGKPVCQVLLNSRLYRSIVWLDNFPVKLQRQSVPFHWGLFWGVWFWCCSCFSEKVLVASPAGHKANWQCSALSVRKRPSWSVNLLKEVASRCCCCPPVQTLIFILAGVAGDMPGRGRGNCWATWIHFSSLARSYPTLQPHELQHARPPCPSPTPRVYSHSCPSSRWCHPAISSSVILFSSCPQSLPASGSFPVSQLFTWGGQSTGVSASASVLQWTPRTDLL